MSWSLVPVKWATFPFRTLEVVLRSNHGLNIGYALDQAWRTSGSRAQNDKRNDFLGTRLSLLSQICISLPDQLLYIVNIYVCIYVYIYIYIYISDCLEIIYELPLLPNNIASDSLFTHIRSCAKCWLDIYHWGASLAVTGRIRDIGQNVL